MAELNERVTAGDLADDQRRIFGRTATVGEHFAVEKASLRVLPSEPFDPSLLLNCRVDTKSPICVRWCFYSVPARYARRRTDVCLGAETVDVLESVT
jgi:hypothetical protein